MGSACKHRIAIISGDPSSILKGSHEFANIQQMFAGSDLQAAVLALRELERQAEDLKKQIGSAKKQLARLMSS